MQTVLATPTQEVRIGPNQPFIIIGERINPTNRSKLAAEMAAGDFSRVKAEALAQVDAGAKLLDINAGIPLADEPAILVEAIRTVQSVVQVPLCIDSSVIPALRAGLAAYRGKALVNSVTGEEERLEAVLPLVREHGAAVIGVTNDESGISEDPQVRFVVQDRVDHFVGMQVFQPDLGLRVERHESLHVVAHDVDPHRIDGGDPNAAAQKRASGGETGPNLLETIQEPPASLVEGATLGR